MVSKTMASKYQQTSNAFEASLCNLREITQAALEYALNPLILLD